MLLDLKPTKTNLPYRIPPWLLPLIFNQLSRADIVECAQVCRAWYRASHDPTLSYKWAYLEFTHFEMPLSRRQLRKRGWKRDVEVEKVASETQLTEGMIECGIMRSGVQLRRLSLGIDARNGNMENGYPCLSESLLTRMFERHRDRMSRLVELSVNVHNAYVDRLLFLLENDPSFLPNLSRLHIGNLDLWPLGTHETVQNLVTFRGLVTDIATCSCCQTIRWGFDTGIDTCSNCQKSYCYDCRYIGPKRCGGYFDCEVQLCQACVILPEVGAKRSGGCGHIYCKDCNLAEDIKCPECQIPRCNACPKSGYCTFCTSAVCICTKCHVCGQPSCPNRCFTCLVCLEPFWCGGCAGKSDVAVRCGSCGIIQCAKFCVDGNKNQRRDRCADCGAGIVWVDTA